MITHGVRVELYGPAVFGVKQRSLLGALQRPGGYTALVVPAKGSKISIDALCAAPPESWKPLLVGTHLVVHDVLHAPVPRREGQTPSRRGRANRTPTVLVVVRAEFHGSVASLIPPLRQFADDGWQLVDQDAESDVGRAWMLMNRERQLRESVTTRHAA
jgi:hypothetical protein